ncbi:MAG: STAS domain-containing protein [Cocleimonas sp.]
MSKAQEVDSLSLEVTDAGLKLDGNLLFSTVSPVLNEGESLLKNTFLDDDKTDSINIDLSGVDKIDSAGISLLLAWKRLCERANKQFQIVSANRQAISLITTNKLEKLLNIPLPK